MTSLSCLPVELIDLVLEHMHLIMSSDCAKQDYHVCTLVSRTWCFLARPYLFRELYYTLCNPARGATQSRKASRRTFDTLHKFMKNHVALAHHVQQLALYLPPAPLGCGISKVDYLDFRSFLDNFPRLQNLQLSNFALDVSPNISYTTEAVQRSLVELNINYSPYYYRHLTSDRSGKLHRLGIKELISCASRIEELKVSGIGELAWEAELGPNLGPSQPRSIDPPADSLRPAIEPSIVNSITLDAVDDPSVLLRLFDECIRHDTIRSLTMTSRTLAPYDLLLRSIGSHLERIQTTMILYPRPKVQHLRPGESTILHPCVNLREIVIRADIYVEHGYPNAELVEVVYLDYPLTKLYSFLRGTDITPSRYPKLAELKVILDIDMVFMYERDQSCEVKVALSGEVSHELDALLRYILDNGVSVKIVVQWTRSELYNWLDLEDCARNLLPTFSARNLLEFRIFKLYDGYSDCDSDYSE